jgi:hypothetical protein
MLFDHPKCVNTDLLPLAERDRHQEVVYIPRDEKVHFATSSFFDKFDDIFQRNWLLYQLLHDLKGDLP